MEALINLLCGELKSEERDKGSEVNLILSHLSLSLTGILDELRSLREGGDQRIMMLAPFLARSWLEVSFTAVIGRLDPFRLLTIRRMQLSSGYDRTAPWKSAIRWQGDVLSPKPKDIWAPQNEPKDITRALFGDYYDELIWKPALKDLSDSVPIDADSRWMTELLANPFESFSPRKREAVAALYSELSKSVHFESVTPSAALADRITIVELVNRCFRETAEVALLANLASHCFSKWNAAEAVDKFSGLEHEEVIE